MAIVGKQSQYPFDPDLVNQICESIRAYQRMFRGERPKGLTLGFGTYLILCETVSEFRYRDFPSGPVEYTNHFQDIPIRIAEPWEFYFNPTSHEVTRVPEHELLFKALNLYFDVIRRLQADAINDPGVHPPK